MKNSKKSIIERVETFRRNKDIYKRTYNEEMLRVEFVNPFFKALGWDVTNKEGNAEAYKDVIHEDAIKIGSATKAPDYAFRIGGIKKFFVEAKKPAVNIKDDIHPAFQLRRYAWSAKLPLSILTDFEEFAVYDCRIRPFKTDKASVGRVMFLTFEDYIEKWDEISNIFSKDAIYKGSFDKYVESSKKKRGTAEVDDAFLKEIETWRDVLARNIALRNTDLTQRELNFAVARTIDRIVFLRIAEDRGMEDYGQLQALQNKENIYEHLVGLYRQADDKYNSGLFHFRQEKDRQGSADELTTKIIIDDKVIKDIVKNLYYPDSSYEFSVLPADILGHIYEQFLGKVISLTAGHRAKIEEKPEVRKAGGVYYTPTYIVNYIVKNTVGELVKSKTPQQVAKLRILDPACGSGSFLIGAYQYLLDWHRDWYSANAPEKHGKGKNPAVFKTGINDWRLTTAKRKEILLNNIYGVDIDPQAVEVSKLSLLLKVLEGESKETLNQQRKLFQERALPDLGNNIKCGNSLIGPDFYDNQQINLLDDEERYRINVFDWEAEFPQIFAKGGFDAVIGNPPWGAQFGKDELDYFRNKFNDIIVRMIDSFMYFIFQSGWFINLNGYYGMILPDVLLYQNDSKKIREHILKNYKINNLINIGDVFDKVTRPASIIIFEKKKTQNNSIKIINLTSFKKRFKKDILLKEETISTIKQKEFIQIPGKMFVTSNFNHYKIWNNINTITHNLLIDIVDEDGIQRGVSPDLKKAFIVESKEIDNNNLEKKKLRKVLTGGKQIKRFGIKASNHWLIYTTKKDNFAELPNICNYIDKYKNEITCKEVITNKHPMYSLHRPRKEEIFVKESKCVGVITSDRIIVTVDKNQFFVTDGVYLFGIKNEFDQNFIIGVLNSTLFVFIYQLLTREKGRVLAQVKPTILNQLPIRKIDFSNKNEKAKHNKMVNLVDRMLELNKQLPKAKTDHDRTTIQRQIDATDKQIDKLVYKLYDLTDEEIKIVEGE